MSMRVRWGLAAIVTVVLIGAVIGIGVGGGGGGSGGSSTPTTAEPPGGGATTSASAAGQTAEQRLAALGPVADQGRSVFKQTGCGGCHRLADAKSGGSIGPDLNQTLSGQDQARIREDIVDPGATIADGFSADIMPFGYETKLSKEQLDALVAYLHAATER